MFSGWPGAGHMPSPDPIPWLERWGSLMGSPGAGMKHPLINSTVKVLGVSELVAVPMGKGSRPGEKAAVRHDFHQL